MLPLAIYRRDANVSSKEMDILIDLYKQEYCTRRLLETDITVHPNIRIQKYLRDYLVSLTEELQRLEQIDQTTDVLENIKYLLEFIAKLSPVSEGGETNES